MIIYSVAPFAIENKKNIKQKKEKKKIYHYISIYKTQEKKFKLIKNEKQNKQLKMKNKIKNKKS